MIIAEDELYTLADSLTSPNRILLFTILDNGGNELLDELTELDDEEDGLDELKELDPLEDEEDDRSLFLFLVFFFGLGLCITTCFELDEAVEEVVGFEFPTEAELT